MWRSSTLTYAPCARTLAPLSLISTLQDNAQTAEETTVQHAPPCARTLDSLALFKTTPDSGRDNSLTSLSQARNGKSIGMLRDMRYRILFNHSLRVCKPPACSASGTSTVEKVNIKCMKQILM